MRKSHLLIFVNMLTNTSPLIHIQFLSCHTATGISQAYSILGAVLAAWIRGTFVDVWNCQIQMGLVLFQNVYRTVKSYKYSINNTDLWNWAMGSFSFQFCSDQKLHLNHGAHVYCFFLKITIIIFLINLIKIFKYFMYVSTIAVDIYHHKKIHLHSICSQCYRNSIPIHQLWPRIVGNS